MAWRCRVLLCGGLCNFPLLQCDQPDSIISAGGPPAEAPQLLDRSCWSVLGGVWKTPVAAADGPGPPRVVSEIKEISTKQDDGFHLLDLETRKRTFFKYEKRVRALSTPEKIFEYFASIEDEGVKSMSHQDLLRALTAVYPPEHSRVERAGALLGEKGQARPKEPKESFSLFDTDGDNKISYQEFILLLTLLSIPFEDAQLVFDIVDLDDNGVIDYAEFMTIINQIQQQTPQGKKDRGGLRTGLKIGDTSRPVGILASFFGESGKKTLPLEKFKSFLQEIHSGLAELEFHHYDFKHCGYIRGWDFARSMCCGVDVQHVDAYLDKVAAMDETLGSHLFSKEEFVGFHRLLGSVHSLSTALRFIQSTRGNVGRKEFSSILCKVAHYKISPRLLDLVFEVFSTEENSLNTSAFLGSLLQHRKTHTLAEGSDGTGKKKSLVQCLYACIA